MSNFTFSIVQELQHQGICDASAAVPLGQDHFLVGNDENNTLRVYQSQKSGQAVKDENIDDYFEPIDDKEADIEGVTQIGEIIYWITSHGTNKDAKPRPKRRQFFANKITNINNFTIKKEGRSYTRLIEDMLEDEQLNNLSGFNLQKAQNIAPKKAGGLNIEGLTTTSDGELLIGFRNPIPQQKALLIPLKNANELIDTTQGNKASFGNPILLDLGSLGIRSIEYWSVINTYLIIAGQFDGGDEFALYTWSGDVADKPDKVSIEFPKDFRPESILLYPHLKDKFQILSDDGSVVRTGGIECKEINDPADPGKFFRSVWIRLNTFL
jgi:hypothetical protein